MSDLVNFVASNGGHVYFGMAEDPAAEIARMQAGTPQRIELHAGWILPPKARADLLDALKHELRKTRRRGEWYEATPDVAKAILRRNAIPLGGKRWEVRKTPLPEEPKKTPGVARAVLTPGGRYKTAKAAGVAYGISRQAAWERASKRAAGWSFEDDDGSGPPSQAMGRPGRPIITPKGRFASSKLAAEAFGISQGVVWDRASRQLPGWHFEDERPIIRSTT